MAFQELSNHVGEAAPHGKVLNQLHGMPTLLAGRLKEQLSKSRTVDGVPGEMGGHGKILDGGANFLLDLLPHGLVAGLDHVDPLLWYLWYGTITFKFTKQLSKVPPEGTHTNVDLIDMIVGDHLRSLEQKRVVYE